MKIIVGLGNPGREYAGTRHNIGFDAVTAIADKYNIRLDTKRFKGVLGQGIINGQKVVLVQPQTYMNLSGECVRAVCDFFKPDIEDVIVLCDDISFDVGRMRIRAKGSAGGHNGLKNIILHLGTEEFARVRIGVGEKPEGWDLADHVLARFPKDVEPAVRDILKKAVEAIECWVDYGIEKTMNLYNINPPKPKKAPKPKPDNAQANVSEEPQKPDSSQEQSTP